MSRTKRIDKKQFKKTAGKCRICGESNYALLDVHRIIHGAVGGEYKENNTVTICCACHRKVHNKDLEIDRYYFSTAGYLLRIVEGGKERFI